MDTRNSCAALLSVRIRIEPRPFSIFETLEWSNRSPSAAASSDWFSPACFRQRASRLPRSSVPSGIVGTSLASGVASFFDAARVPPYVSGFFSGFADHGAVPRSIVRRAASWEPFRLLAGTGSSFGGIGSRRGAGCDIAIYSPSRRRLCSVCLFPAVGVPRDDSCRSPVRSSSAAVQQSADRPGRPAGPADAAAASEAREPRRLHDEVRRIRIDADLHPDRNPRVRILDHERLVIERHVPLERGPCRNRTRSDRACRGRRSRC